MTENYTYRYYCLQPRTSPFRLLLNSWDTIRKIIFTLLLRKSINARLYSIENSITNTKILTILQIYNKSLRYIINITQLTLSIIRAAVSRIIFYFLINFTGFCLQIFIIGINEAKNPVIILIPLIKATCLKEKDAKFTPILIISFM